MGLSKGRQRRQANAKDLGKEYSACWRSSKEASGAGLERGETEGTRQGQEGSRTL